MKWMNPRNLVGLRALLIGGSALVGTLLTAAPVAAQESGTTAGAVETITVTARKREEDIHNVPAQVTAFTADTIEARGITKPIDFISAVPNVTFVETQNAGTSFLVIRGISQARNSEPSAAIVVDGVPMTQPAQFNQEMLDIQQIEVIKGPQGALYGRNAIGGAILITTKRPTDEWEGRATAGYESGPGWRAQAVISGPLTDTFKMRAAGSYFDTDGHLTNINTADASAEKNVDPVKDLNARLSFLWEPTDNFTADLRLSMDLLKTRALYYVIDAFGSPGFNDPNNTSVPIALNNSGKNDRKIYDAALKLTYDNDWGTLTSITGYNSVWEILTGDGYTFDPFGASKIFFDFNQSQFLDVQTFSQEVRYTSPSDRRIRWIAGAQMFITDRFISTGNMCDVADEGVAPTYHDPFPYCFATFPFPPHGQISFLSDSQDQFAWAIYLDTSWSITDELELSLNIRYDNDHRENTTETPQFFLTVAGIPGATGDVRSNTWDDVQPQAIIRYQPSDALNLYASYSRGFRSGGFNQTGVATAAAAAGFDNVGDLFDQETADTFEAGFKSLWFDNRVALNGSVYSTVAKGTYYFVFLASNSTQNLGNIQQVEYIGFDIDLNARVTDELTLNAGFGYTDSEVTRFPGASSALVVGSKAPLVSDYTLNVGLQYLAPVFDDFDALVRVDYNRIGPTTFVIPVPAAGEPVPIARDPVDLVDLRAGLQSDEWSVIFWSKNLFDKEYNTEYSTGGFLFKAQPMRWGLDVTKRF